MISLRVGDCSVDILPIVNGLVSEADRVLSEFREHEAYAASLGIEGIQTIKNREDYDGDYEVSELDLVYARHLQGFGSVEFPSPGMCAFIDRARELGKNVIPLDMNDEDFTTLYCDTVGAFDFTNEHRLAKKGLKMRISSDTAEGFAVEWDAFVNGRSKGQRRLCAAREGYMADQITDIARYKKDLLVVMEVERTSGVERLLRERHGLRQMRWVQGGRMQILRLLRFAPGMPRVREQQGLGLRLLRFLRHETQE